MKVILVKDIANIGKEGAILDVKDGFARNYLLPQRLALIADANSAKQFEAIKRKQMKLCEAKKKEFLHLKESIEAIALTISVEVKNDDEIYGSISETQILKALKDESVDMPKGCIVIEEPIKKIGVYNVKVKLDADVSANLRVWVVKK